MNMRKLSYSLLPIILVTILVSVLLFSPQPASSQLRSDSVVCVDNIQLYLEEQLNLGFRIPGTEGAMAFWDWIDNRVNLLEGWKNTHYDFTFDDIDLKNFLITEENFPVDTMPHLLIGAHWDSRAYADKSDNNITLPVPGANDAGSGVAAILEIMHHIPENYKEHVGFVLFDAEDQGGQNSHPIFSNWGWIEGAKQFANDLTEDHVEQIDAFVLLDMIGDDELRLPYESGSYNSDPDLVAEIWNLGISMGYEDIFVFERGAGLIDDHVPFRNRGIPAIDIIDFTYPEHHTEFDNLDNVSAENIGIVTDVMIQWIITRIANDFGLELPSSSSTTNGVTTETYQTASTSTSTNSIDETIGDMNDSKTTDCPTTLNTSNSETLVSISQDSNNNDSNYPVLGLFGTLVFFIVVGKSRKAKFWK